MRERALRELYDPASPYYHQWLTCGEFTELFGPTEADVRKVVQFAGQHGLTVTDVHSNRMVVNVSGTIAEINSAFQVRMQLYQHPTENRSYFADQRGRVLPDCRAMSGSTPLN